MDYRSKIRDSRNYIEKNLDQKISLDDLARKVHLSKYYYHRLFHKMEGESITKFINKRRMEQAADALVKTNQPIIEIALKYQYGSQESFSRAFKRVYGLTPGKYRKTHLKSNPTDCSIRLNRIMAAAA